jgi:hypothetical protein
VGGFGITDSDDLLFVEDVQLVKQTCSWAHVAFDDESVADLFDRQIDNGRRPEQFARLWLHTHPGECPRPSLTDEETFTRVFGRAEWAMMFILACEGQSYAWLRFNVGPGAELQLPVEIDYSRPFDGCDIEAWEAEYFTNVQPQQPVRKPNTLTDLDADSVTALPSPVDPADDWYESWLDYIEHADHEEGIVL